MSAFVVRDETINSVISFLTLSRDMDWMLSDIQRETGCFLKIEADCAKLGRAMFDLNCQAVDARYGEGQAQEFRDLDYSYRLCLPVTAIQAHKSLSCWLYQCSEGDIPGTSLLFSTMDRVKSQIADHIVSRLAEYETAKWG